MVRANLSTTNTRTFQGLFKANFAIFKDNKNKHKLQKQRKTISVAFILAYYTMKPLYFKSQETNTQKHEARRSSIFFIHTKLWAPYRIFHEAQLNEQLLNYSRFSDSRQFNIPQGLCLVFKEFSRKNSFQVLFKANVNFEGLLKTV